MSYVRLRRTTQVVLALSLMTWSTLLVGRVFVATAHGTVHANVLQSVAATVSAENGLELRGVPQMAVVAVGDDTSTSYVLDASGKQSLASTPGPGGTLRVTIAYQ